MSTAMTVQKPSTSGNTTGHAPRLKARDLCSTGMLLFTSGLAAATGVNFGDDARLGAYEDRASRPSSYYEINSVVLPDFGDYSARINALPGNPGYSINSTQSIDLTGWLITREAYGRFGLSMGMSAPAAGASTLAADAVPPSSLDLGVRWRSQRETGPQLDITAWARAPQVAPGSSAMAMIRDDQPVLYGTRVEVQWESSKTRGLVPEFGAVGVQLQGSSRLLLRARKGGPMLYYRSRF